MTTNSMVCWPTCSAASKTIREYSNSKYQEDRQISTIEHKGL